MTYTFGGPGGDQWDATRWGSLKGVELEHALVERASERASNK